MVVETLVGRTDAVARELACIEGVEVHGVNGYKIVVTIEADSVDASHATASAFVQIEGVVGVNLVYCNFEDVTLGANAELDARATLDANADCGV